MATSATFPDGPFALAVTFKCPAPGPRASVQKENTTLTRPAQLRPGLIIQFLTVFLNLFDSRHPFLVKGLKFIIRTVQKLAAHPEFSWHPRVTPVKNH